MKRIFAVLACVFCVLPPAFSESVTLLLSQDDPVSQTLRASTMTIENSLMDVFFENGCVVSNEPATMAARDSDEYSALYRKACGGRVKYVLAVTVVYKSDASDEIAKPILGDIDEVSWELHDSKSGEIRAQGVFLPSCPHGKSAEDGVLNFGSDLARLICRDMAGLRD